MRLKSAGLLAMVLGLALSACGIAERRPDDPCRPVDVGGDCFAPSPQGFADHALASAKAWPQLNGMSLTAARLIEAQNVARNEPNWIVPLTASGKVYAASRFLPAGRQVRLAEIALYEPALASFPHPQPGHRLVLRENGCPQPTDASCLFSNFGWEIDAEGN